MSAVALGARHARLRWTVRGIAVATPAGRQQPVVLTVRGIAVATPAGRQQPVACCGTGALSRGMRVFAEPAPWRGAGASWAAGQRRMSSAAKGSKEGEPMFLSLPGSADAHTIKVNKEKRLIVGLEHTMRLLSSEIAKEVPGVVSTLNDNGLPEIRWSPAQGDAVMAYLKAHEFSEVEAGYVYEGAFASGVKKVKLLSLFSLAFTSIGGPLLVIGDSAATAMQWGMAGAVVFFGTSTTGLLHMITSPYVLSLRRLADGSFEAVKPLLTGGETVSRFRTEDIQASSMPFETFKAQGPGQKLQGYYIHKELFLGDEGQDMLCQLLGVEAAEDMYEKQLNENPSDLDALYNYGRFLWKVRKDLAAAEGAFVRVLENDPLDEDAKVALLELGRELAHEADK